MDGKQDHGGHSEAARRCVQLPGWSVLEAEGADAGAFLQAQTMNDLRGLADGQWQWNGCLTPKGRVFALFALLRIASDRYWLVALDLPAAELAAHLRRYVFRSKVRLSPRTDLHACGSRDAAAHEGARGARAAIGGAGGPVALDLSGQGSARWLVLGGAAGMDDPAAAAQWLAEDLRHGLPHLQAGHREAFTPQMLALERLQAFSLKKGCYPGQEIVARTHYLGQAKRGLALLRVDGAAAAGDEVGGAASGPVVSAVAVDGATLALAVLPAPPPEQGVSVGESTAATLDLLDGLAR